MNATTQNDWAPPAPPAETETNTLCSYRSTASALRKYLVSTFVAFAIVTLYPERSSAAAVLPCPHSMATTPREAARDTASVFELGRDGLDQDASDSAIQGIIWGPILGVILILTLLGCCAEHTRRRVRREEANEQVSMAVARELRRDHEERTRRGIAGTAPTTNITFVEMQRERQAGLDMGRRVTQLQPTAFPQPHNFIYPPVEPVTRPKPPPAYFSQDGLPAYAGASSADQVLGRGDAGMERPGAIFTGFS